MSSKLKEVFKRAPQATKGAALGVTLRNRPTKGDVGIEIEVEGSRLLHAEDDGELLMPGWRYHIDGSLRGEENAEYVSDGPIPFDRVKGEVDKLFAALSDNNAEFDESNRTSVHVHLNCQPLFLNEFTSFAALYFIFEEILTEWCGDHRVGNLFCLRAKDAPGIISNLERFVINNGDWQFSEALHYAAFNPQALNKFGSIEIRTMRGVTDPELIVTWVGILQRLYDYARENKDPRRIIEMFSGEGPLRFYDMILGGTAGMRLRKDLGMSDQFIRDSMYQGVRMVQRLCYCRDWSKYEMIDLKEDPFGRDQGQILAALNNTGHIDDMIDGPDYFSEPFSPPPMSGAALQYGLTFSASQQQDAIILAELNALTQPATPSTIPPSWLGDDEYDFGV